MTNVPLQDIASIHGGGRLKLSGNHFVPEGVPAYGAGGQNGFVATAEYADREAVILSSVGARCGKCFHVSGGWTSLANTQVILPDPSRVDSRFLWFQLNDEARWPRSGSAQPFIKPSDVKAQKVWLPSLDEQRRIAAILDQADGLRAKRRQALAHLDTLTHSIFHQMFSGSTFEHAPLRELMDVRSSLVRPDPETMGELPHIGPDSLMSGRGSIAGWRTLAEDGVTSGKYRFQAGDVLYSKIRPNLNKVATAPFSGLCSADMYALVPRTSVATAPFLEHVLRTPAFLGYADRLSNRANIPKLNRRQLESYVAPLAPIALQMEFSRRIDAVGASRQSVEAAQIVDDEMFASLESRAFRGEL